MIVKRIVITGANKGIGFATAEAILKKYDDILVIVGAKDAQR